MSLRYSTKNLSSPIKAYLHFSISKSGIISLDRSEAVVEYFEWVEVPKKNISLENVVASELNSTQDAGSVNSTEESKETLNSDEKVDILLSANETQPDVEVPMEKKLKKRIFRVPLKVTTAGRKTNFLLFYLVFILCVMGCSDC